MQNKELMNMLIKQLNDYIPKAKESITRNNHMNDYKDEEFSQDIVFKILAIYVNNDNFEDLLACPSKIDLLEKMTQIAKDNFKKIEDVSQNIIDALLIDFINYVGMGQGVDYAIYTTDLYKKR